MGCTRSFDSRVRRINLEQHLGALSCSLLVSFHKISIQLLRFDFNFILSTETPTLGRLEILAGKHNLALVEPSEQRIGIDRDRSLIHPGWNPGPQVGPDDLVLVNY